MERWKNIRANLVARHVGRNDVTPGSSDSGLFLRMDTTARLPCRMLEEL